MNMYTIRQQLREQSIYDIPLRVVFYARVSTEKEEQKSSIRNQQDYYQELIDNNKSWTFCGKYIDEGLSGKTAEKRESFQNMIRDAKEGKFDLIITKEISRFARNTLDSILYTRELLANGVCVWFQNDNINTVDEDSELRLTIMAGVAQDEIRKLSTRIKFGHERSIRNGVVMGNSRLYGYDKEKGRLTINEKEAEMIRLIFEKYATGQWSTPKLEQLLFDKGYRNYSGKKIDRGVIQHIIKNPKYKGYYVGGKVKIIDMFTSKQEFLPEKDWIMYKDDGSRVPAIVSEEIWAEANRIFDIRSREIKDRRTSFKGDNLFTGKIFCGNDGKPYWMQQRALRGKEDIRWRCSHKIKNGADSCNSFSICETELKKMIVNLLASSVDNLDALAADYGQMLEKATMDCDFAGQMRKAEDEILAVRKKRDKILDYNLDGKISDEEFLLRNTEFNDRINVLEEKIAGWKAQQEKQGDFAREMAHMAGMVKQFATMKEDDLTRQVVERLIDRVNVYPEGDHTARVEVVLFPEAKGACCSGDMILTIYPPT